MMYEQCRTQKPEPSMRAALRRYRAWSVGKKYGDGKALKYSDMQLRHYFAEAALAAHLWAAFRLLRTIKDRGKSYNAAFTPKGMPYFLGIARELQEFAATFVPKRTKPAKPVVNRQNMFLVPASIEPIAIDLRPL